MADYNMLMKIMKNEFAHTNVHKETQFSKM